MPEEVKKEEIKKPKGPFGKLKEKVEDSEEHLAILSTFVRLGILVWSGGILTLNYVTIPNLPQQKIDPTFIASVFTGVLATFGVQTAKKNGDKANGGGGGGITKEQMERLIEKAAQTAPTQTIKIEQAPVQITTNPDTYKM